MEAAKQLSTTAAPSWRVAAPRPGGARRAEHGRVWEGHPLPPGGSGGSPPENF